MIRSFRDKDTQRLWHRERVRRLGPDVHRSALKRLTRLDAAESLDDLRAFPGNRLEKLRGDRQGQHSIRINDQWRICFVWTDAGPEDVEIVDLPLKGGTTDDDHFPPTGPPGRDPR